MDMPPSQIRSIGRLDAELNPKTSHVVIAAVAEVLGEPADRVFINLDDVAIHHSRQTSLSSSHARLQLC